MASFRVSRKGKGLQQHAVALFLSVLSVPALAGDISVSARDVNEALWRGDHIEVKYSAQAKFPANDPRYKVVPIKYKASDLVKRSIQDVVKNPGRAAVSAAVVGAVASAGWLIDEVSGQVVMPDQPIDGYQQGIYWYSSADSSWRASTSAGVQQQASEFCSSGAPHNSYPTLISSWFDSDGYCRYRMTSVSTGEEVSLVAYASVPKQATCSGVAEPYCPANPPTSSGNVSEDDLSSVLSDVLKDMSPAELRDFFKNGGYLPELTPELNAALQDWANELGTETGLDPADAAEEETASDTPEDVQDVRVVDPVAIDGSDVPSEVPDTSWSYTGDIFKDREADINDLTGGTAAAPTINLPINLPESSACQQLSFEWFGHTTSIPGEQGCSAAESIKEMLAYLFAIFTAFTCFEILTKPRSI